MGIVRIANLNKKIANLIGVFNQEIGVFLETQLYWMLFFLDKTTRASVLDQLAPIIQAKLVHEIISV